MILDGFSRTKPWPYLKVFDKEMSGKVPLGEVVHCLSSLGEKLESDEVDRLMKILEVTEDEDGFVPYEGKREREIGGGGERGRGG